MTTTPERPQPGLSKLKGFNFWRERLSLLEGGFSLRGGGRRATHRGATAGLFTFTPNDACQANVARITRGTDVETYVVVLSGLLLLLSKYTGADVVCVHSPLLAGQGLDTDWPHGVPLIEDLSGVESLRDLIVRVDQITRASYLNQHLLPGYVSKTGAAPVHSNVAVSSRAIHRAPSGPPVFDLSFDIGREVAGGPFFIEVAYDRGAFDEWLVEDMTTHLQRILEGYSNLSSSVEGVRVLDATEEERILSGFNRSHDDTAREETLVTRFRAQAKRTPEKAAVISEGVALSYRELDRRSDELAAHLAARFAVASEELVGLYSGKSCLSVVAILGILKAGAAYVPLDTKLPTQRLNFILADAQVRLLVTESEHLLDLADCDAELFCIDVEEYGGTAQAAADCRADGLAYAIFTSGSTGEPKGVCIEHRAILSYLDWKCRFYGFDESYVTLQIPSFSFDSSVSDIFSTLLSGGCLVLLRDEDRLDVGKLLGLIGAHQVTNFVAVPSMYRVILPHLGAARGGLRVVTLAGEAVPYDLVLKHRECLPSVRLINEYGPTENSVGATAHEYFLGADTELTIGRPMSHTLAYVLNEKLSPVPVGFAGELCVGGAGLARGYLNREDLTRRSFVPNPFRPGGRLYRTGDYGRWLRDGSLEFLARRDEQVKVRGHRVELAEVETALRSLEEVEDAVVLATDAGGRGLELVAYLVAQSPGTRPPRLAEQMRLLLPDYMLPSHYVLLPALPLTTSGKVDRSALPAPAAAADREYEQPRDELEELVAAIWEQQLGVSPVGVRDDFFQLGGHSLKAIQIALMIQQEANVQIGLWELFGNPTVGKLCALLRQKMAERLPAIEPLPAQGSYEVSHAQRRMWVLEQLGKGGASPYNIPDLLLLEGPLDAGALGRAFESLVRRHESLRTGFKLAGGELRQEVHEEVAFRLDAADLSGSPDPEEELRRVAGDAAGRAFDLEAPPLFQAALVRLGAESHALLLTLHHIICDGSSAHIFVSELLRLYEAHSQGLESALPPLKIHYKDFVAWQKAALGGPEAERSRQYWRAKLGGERPPLLLPADRPRPAVQTFNGDYVGLSLDPGLTSELREMARTLQVSMFILLQAVVKVLLYRHTSQADLAVGSLISGRAHPDLQNVVGLFLNTMVLRDRVSGDESFTGLLGRVKQTTLEAFEHHWYPFDLLVDELAPVRDMARNPLFDVMFTVDDESESYLKREYAARAGGLTVARRTVDYDVSKFDLAFIFDNAAESLGLTIQYNTDMFSAARVGRMAGHLHELLRSVVRDPGRRVAELQMLTPEELHRVLHSFNETRSVRAPSETVIDAFERRVEESPEAPAVEGAGETLTYAELNRRANRLAWCLTQRHGVARGELVGVRCGRSAEAVVAALGALKAGAAYLPIDPAEPEERAAFFLADSGCRLLLAVEECREGFGGLPAERVICVPSVNGGRALDPPRVVGASDLCYVIYTSGSTGRPKGVMVEHGSLMNLVRWYQSVCPADETSRATLYASPGFDASMLELWPHLLGGACMVPVPDPVRLDPEALLGFLRDRRITNAFLPTSVCEIVCGPGGGKLGSELTLITGGEVLRLFRPAPAAVLNVYGPTEATVGASAILLRAGEAPPTSSIGKPLDNYQLYILDSRLQPVPVGVEGEIYIAGAGLARGYVNAPALTAAAFLPHPFGEGGRLYRTGDTGRWAEDGSIEFTGRTDEQIKVRGSRVEPSEVERVLLDFPAVREAAVRAVQLHGQHQLVAYVVFRSGQGAESGELGDFLRTCLPEYMVPSVFCTLDALPRTAGGKVDRKSLPTAVATPERGEVGSAGFGSAAADILANIWMDILGAARVSPEDNFFELGGDSLKAMRVIVRVRETFGAELTLRTLFEVPTLARMIHCVETSRPTTHALPPVISSCGSEDGAPLSLAQEQMWAAEQLAGERTQPNISCALLVKGAFDLEAFRLAVSGVVERHESLRTTFAVEGGRPVQVIADAARPHVTHIDLRGLPAAEQGERARDIARREAAHHFDYTGESLLRITSISLSGDAHVLSLTAAHIISDGWSLGLFLKEWAALYRARVQGLPASLPRLPVQYRDFVRWQNDCLRSGAFNAQAIFWMRRLGGELPELLFRGSLPAAPGPRLGMKSSPFRMGAGLTEALRATNRREASTMFMTLLAAFKALLFRYTGCEDIRLGTLLAGRTRNEVENLIGLFVNTVPLRTDLSGNPSLGELLRRVREVTLDAYANQDLPFEALARIFERHRGLSRSDLFNVLFVLQSAPAGRVELPGLSVTDFTGWEQEAEGTLTNFDLVIFLREEGDEVTGVATYNPEVLAPRRLEGMLEYYRLVLEELTRNPDKSLDRLPPPR